MSYLNVPRIHFSGRFQADPSTINNSDPNWNPDEKYTDQSVSWNPNGTHNFKFLGCTVRGAANDQGPFTSPSSDPVIGAKVEPQRQIPAKGYPGKLVDLDPDNQGVSQIWGMEIGIFIPDPADSTKILASVGGSLPPTAFGDLWSRAVGGRGMPAMSACFQQVLGNLVWVSPEASPLLTALKAASPDALSIRFIVDTFQPNSNASNFTYGRVVGTIGPAYPGEAPRSTPRRLAPQNFNSPPPPPSIKSSCGAAGAVWDARRGKLILDLGNTVPTQAAGGTVPDAGWPITSSTWRFSFAADQSLAAADIKRGKESASPAAFSADIPFTLDTYLTYAGIVEIPIPADQVSALQSQPLSAVDTANASNLVQEDPQGRYVDVSLPFLRLNPGQVGQTTLWATKFGLPWAGASLDWAIQPPSQSGNGEDWLNGFPKNVLAPSAGTATTGPDGTATISLTAGDPGVPRKYDNGKPGPDGQIYYATGPWQNWGQIFLFSGAPINLLVFSGYTVPDQPTWFQDVEPILGLYARMYPYMKTIIDIGDYDTVVENIGAIETVLSLPQAHPHYMPIVRDLSLNKLAMIKRWIANGAPKGAAPPSSPSIA